MAPKAANDDVDLLSAADRDVLAKSNRLQELAYEGVSKGSALCALTLPNAKKYRT
jgi:hypothetical protein